MPADTVRCMPAEGAFWVVFLLLVAPAVGSFLGVLVDRLPRGEDVLGRPSACRSCGARLGPLDLIPILSFIALRGACRRCRAPLAGWHLYLEIAALGGAVMAVAAGGPPAVMWLNALFLWCLLGLLSADLLWFRLPDPLNAALFAIALALSALPGQIGALPALAGAALGSGSFWALRIAYQALRGREGLGLGDVKLMAGLGAYAGAFDLPLVLLIASLGALLTGLAVHLMRGGLGGRRGSWAMQRLPFGAALCGAAIALWVIRQGTGLGP